MNMNIARNACDYWHCHLIGPYQILIMSQTGVHCIPMSLYLPVLHVKVWFARLEASYEVGVITSCYIPHIR